MKEYGSLDELLEEREIQRKKREKQKHDRLLSRSNNFIADIVKIMGFVFLGLGFIMGIILGQNIYEYGHYQFNYTAMIITWVSSGLSAIVFFAFAEIIQILHDIRLKIYKK